MTIDTYFSPNKRFPVRQLVDSHPMDPLREFSEVCREQLADSERLGGAVKGADDLHEIQIESLIRFAP